MDKKVRDALVKTRAQKMELRNEQRQKVLGHILWVSATVFAVTVIGGSLEPSAPSSVIFLVSVVLNALCVLFCSISFYGPVNSADRSQAALARLLKGKSSQRSGRTGNEEIHRIDHRNLTIFVYQNGGDTDIEMYEGRRKLFEFCEIVSYVCFLLMIVCLAIFALTR